MLTLWLAVSWVGAAQAQSASQFSNTTTGAIADNTCGTGNTITRTFSVTVNVKLTDINLGVLLAHTYRGDLRITLTSPAGTTIAMITNVGASRDNLNVLFDDAASASISTHTSLDDTSTGAPPYSRTFAPQSPLAGFNNQNSLGTWTLGICDSQAVDIGTFNRADLYVAGHQADLSLAMTSSAATPLTGSNMTFTLTAASAAGSTTTATGIAASDLLPSGLTFVSASGSGSYTPGSGVWTIGSLAPGASGSLTITATVTAAGGASITNTAQITASSLPDPNSTPNNGLTSEDDYASRTVTAQSVNVTCAAGSSATGSGYAASGASVFIGQVFWMDWSCGATTQFYAGQTITKTWTVGDGLVLTGQISSLTRSINPYTTGNYFADSLNVLHGGVNPIGLINAVAGEDPTFTLSLSGALNGTPVALRYVIADAEDSNGAASNESVQAVTNGTAWQTVEQYGSISVINSGSSTTIYDPASGGPGTAVVETSASNLSLNVTINAGGGSAAAFGIFTPYDFSDAPLTGTSYGSASHRSLTGLRLGPAVTSENTVYDSANASADVDDGVGNDPLFRGRASTFTAQVSGPGKLSGWADWNDDGDFADSGEQIAINAIDGGSGDSDGLANGSIVVSVTPPVTAATTPTVARFRFSSNAGASSSGLAGFGEVEDFEFSVIYPSLAVSKSSAPITDPFNGAVNPKAIPGGTVKYCVLVTNDGSASASTIVLSDTLPASLSYVAGTLHSGSTCAGAATVEDDDAVGADESDPVGASVSGASIAGSASTLAVGASIALTYQAALQ